MLQVINALSQQPYVITECRRVGIAVATWRAITVNDAIDCDGRTGRGLRTSQEVAAARVQRDPKTVQRARSINVRLGILVEVYRGRELSRDERLELVAAQPGHKQRGIPNEYAMTVCPPRQRARISIPAPGRFAHLYSFVHLPPGGGHDLGIYLLSVVTSAAADAAKGKEPPPAARRQRKKPRALGLASGFLAQPGLMPLFADVRPGTVVAQLTAYHRGGWSPSDLATAVLAEAHRRGVHTGRLAHKPWALLKTLLAGIDPVSDVHLAVRRPDPLPLVQPCARVECYRGWIEVAWGKVMACPDCPPAVRRSETWTPAETGDDGTAAPELDQPQF